MQPSEYAVGIMLIQQGKPCWQRVTRKTKGPADGVLSSLGKLLTELLWHYRKPLEWGHYLLWSYPRDGPKGEITSIIIATTTNSEQTWLSYRHGAKCFAFIISFNPHNVVSLWHGYYYDLCLLDNETEAERLHKLTKIITQEVDGGVTSGSVSRQSLYL